MLGQYLNYDDIGLEEIVDFHVKFEKIHPFADGNGRVGRLITFKECLKNNLVPSIILDDYRTFYLKGSLHAFRAGQDYSEEILKQLNFKGEINSN